PAGDRRRGAVIAARARAGGHDDRGAGGAARRRPHRRAPLHPRSARSRPGHPDQRRAADERVPALAERALGVLLLRGILAGLPPDRLPARAAGVRGPAPPLRRLTARRAGWSCRSVRVWIWRASTSCSG